jgi:hypothetical protein
LKMKKKIMLKQKEEIQKILSPRKLILTTPMAVEDITGEEVQANGTNLISTMVGSQSIRIDGKMGEVYFWNPEETKVKEVEVEGIKLN